MHMIINNPKQSWLSASQASLSLTITSSFHSSRPFLPRHPHLSGICICSSTVFHCPSLLSYLSFPPYLAYSLWLWSLTCIYLPLRAPRWLSCATFLPSLILCSGTRLEKHTSRLNGHIRNPWPLTSSETPDAHSLFTFPWPIYSLHLLVEAAAFLRAGGFAPQKTLAMSGDDFVVTAWRTECYSISWIVILDATKHPVMHTQPSPDLPNRWYPAPRVSGVKAENPCVKHLITLLSLNSQHSSLYIHYS